MPLRLVSILLSIALLSGGAWFVYRSHYVAGATIKMVDTMAPLLDYREVYEDGRPRESNETMRKVIAELIVADDIGLDLREIFRQVEWKNQTPVNYSDLLTERLLSNLQLAREYGLDTPENLTLMIDGKAPYVTKGEYAGQKIHIDHIVPKELAPDLDNLLINLEPLPEQLNLSKSDKVDARVRAVAKRFYDAGVMQAESWERVSES